MPALDKKNSGFTLTEILIVIAIIAIIGSAIFGNFFSSIARGRDSRRKQDLRSIAGSLELYYNDNGRYPDGLPVVGDPFTHPDDSNIIYLRETPGDPKTGSDYCYETDDGSWYRMAVDLENLKDPDILVTPTNCLGSDYNFGVFSSNTLL